MNKKKITKEVISYVPLQLIIMFMTCVLLFGNLKDPIIIFGVLPLSFIGILPGLFITGRTFGFMAIIGTISLSGMMNKKCYCFNRWDKIWNLYFEKRTF